VVNSFSDNLSVINATTLRVLASIPVGLDPIGIAFSESNDCLYVANNWSNSLTFVVPELGPESTQTLSLLVVPPEGQVGSPIDVVINLTGTECNGGGLARDLSNVTVTFGDGSGERSLALPQDSSCEGPPWTASFSVYHEYQSSGDFPVQAYAAWMDGYNVTANDLVPIVSNLTGASYVDLIPLSALILGTGIVVIGIVLAFEGRKRD